MSEINITVSLSPVDTLNLLKKEEGADLVHEEIKELSDKHTFAVLIFEKYFMNVKNRVSLVVIVDDTNGVTEVRAIATGSSDEMMFNLDMGASDDFAIGIEEMLRDYIID